MVDTVKRDMRSKDPKIRREATKKRMKFLQATDKTQSMRTRGKLIPASKERSSSGGKPKLTKEQLLQQAQGKRPTGGPSLNPSVRRDKRKLKKFALGGEAAESVGRATVERSQRKILRKRVDDMLDRVYGTAKGKPKIQKIKKKPKDPKRIVPKKKPKLKPLKKPSEMKGLPPKR